jgi:hypothetical protein
MQGIKGFMKGPPQRIQTTVSVINRSDISYRIQKATRYIREGGDDG